jgi:FlgN protein
MEKAYLELHQQLQKLLTLHRQLLELLRAEREAIVAADVEKIEARALEKQGLLDQIALADNARRRIIEALASGTGAIAENITLSRVAIAAQGVSVKMGEQFRSVQQALSHILGRVEEQGSYNRALVERSLEAITQMKRNIVGGESPQSSTYSSTGQKTNQAAGARLISKEV